MTSLLNLIIASEKNIQLVINYGVFYLLFEQETI